MSQFNGKSEFNGRGNNGNFNEDSILTVDDMNMLVDNTVHLESRITPVNRGGTGRGTNFTSKGVVFADSATELASTSAGNAGSILISNGGVNNNPSFSTTLPAAYTFGRNITSDTGGGVWRDNNVTGNLIGDARAAIRKRAPIAGSEWTPLISSRISNAAEPNTNANSNNNQGCFSLGVYSSSGPNSMDIVWHSATGTASETPRRWRFVDNGAFEASTIRSTSDKRLKKEIKDFNTDRSILELDVKEYKYKDSDKKSIGFIAQELKEVFPELVHGDEKKKDEYLSIEESKLAYLLLIELKKMRKELDELKAKKEDS
ncbi:MAG: tail fiber domain-containing protein [Firmicutes bacterium]|nr:tail fiber domain-containing protein [Bacillota bacterium]